MSKKETILINFDDLAEKRQFLSGIQSLRGLYEVSIRPRKLRRSLDQNGYYHAAFVDPFMQWLRENWGERIDHDQAHETLKLAVMDIDRVEGIPIMPSTRKLDTGEFSAFLEKAAQFLATKCGIVVLPAEMFYEVPERGQSSRTKNPKQSPAQQPRIRAHKEQPCQQN